MSELPLFIVVQHSNGPYSCLVCSQYAEYWFTFDKRIPTLKYKTTVRKPHRTGYKSNTWLHSLNFFTKTLQSMVTSAYRPIMPFVLNHHRKCRIIPMFKVRIPEKARFNLNYTVPTYSCT